MAKTITLQDIPEKDLERYYELVQASKWKKEFEDKRKDKYIVDYRLRNLDGSYIKHSTKTFNKDKDAKAFINSLQNEHAIFLYKQEHPENAMTFRELYDEYESSRAFKDKPGTIINRKSIVNSRIMVFFGDMLISEISEEEIEKWQFHFVNPDGTYVFSECYLRSLHARLSAILNYAVKRKYITWNPASGMSIGTKNGPEKPVWTPEEYNRFRKCIEDKPEVYYAFETLYHTGVRRGELLALQVGDFDVAHQCLRITKSLSRLNGKDVIGTPKTKKSVRNVKIGQMLSQELLEHIASLPDNSPTASLFPLSIHTLRNALEKGTKEAGLTPISLHCFRHSHITNLIFKRFSPSDIAMRVGHESVYITMHYAHAYKGVEDEMAMATEIMMKEV